MADNKKEDILQQVMQHYDFWTEDNDKRKTRKNGWDDVTDAYWGKLPDSWPYQSKVVDPRIQTSLKEKNARLINTKLRGRLAPREGGDILKARFNTTVLDYQWDTANHGGSMLEKMSIADMDARLYASKFALVKWLREEDGDKVTFDGNEFMPLDIRDCGIDPSANNIRDAKWFQHREWKDLNNVDESLFPGLKKLKNLIEQSKDKRDNAYTSRLLHNKGLEDRLGYDDTYQTVEWITEYRPDRWITFSQKHNIIIRDIPNPYNHRKIPIAQLKYYALGDDPIGESEVEPVLPLWKAIQAVVNGYLDNMQLHIRPPLKIIEGMVRMETIKYGPEAKWLMDTQDAVQELMGSTDPMRHFQTAYSAMVSAFNTAMGDLSQGVSQISQFNPEKTATEVKQTALQQLTRDQRNQLTLSEFIKDVMSMWLSNNQQFLFMDPDKKQHVLRIVGQSNFEYFQRSGLDGMTVDENAMKTIQETISAADGQISDEQLMQMYESAKTPINPVAKETEDGKISVKPKMEVSPQGDEATITLLPEDIDGTYDYIPDIRSMAQEAGESQLNAKISALQMLANPTMLQLLTQEGFTPKVKDLLTEIFNDQGNLDSEKFFEAANPAQLQAQAGIGSGQAQQQSGVPGNTPPVPQNPSGQQMGGSFDMQK